MYSFVRTACWIPAKPIPFVEPFDINNFFSDKRNNIQGFFVFITDEGNCVGVEKLLR